MTAQVIASCAKKQLKPDDIISMDRFPQKTAFHLGDLSEKEKILPHYSVQTRMVCPVFQVNFYCSEGQLGE